MAGRSHRPQAVRRKSMRTDNPNFDPNWDCLWWGKKASDITKCLHPLVPPHSGRVPPYDPDAPHINPYDYKPYEWPVHAINHTTRTEYALDAARKPTKPTDTRTYAAPILKETTKPEAQKSYTKPLGLCTHIGEKEYTKAAKFTTRSVPGPQVKELTPHVFGHPERLGDPAPKPDYVLQSRAVRTPHSLSGNICTSAPAAAAAC